MTEMRFSLCATILCLAAFGAANGRSLVGDRDRLAQVIQNISADLEAFIMKPGSLSQQLANWELRKNSLPTRGNPPPPPGSPGPESTDQPEMPPLPDNPPVDPSEVDSETDLTGAITDFQEEEKKVKSVIDVMETPPGTDPNYYEEVLRKKGLRESMGTFTTISGINHHVNLTGVVEGDIRVLNRRNRNAASSDKWPKSFRGRYRGLVPIPYKISSRYNRTQLDVIKSAMQIYANHTCIRFVPRSSEISYIAIKDGKGCWAYVGKTGLSEQTVSLGIPGCVAKGIAAHELMHVVGFQHEHSRSDRDQHVKIVSHNIQKDMSLNFARYNDTTNLVIYDYNSVMHYGRTAFSKEPYLPTIQVVPKRKPEPSIGQRERMSPYDIEEIKYLYKCAAGTYKRCGQDFVNRQSGSFSSPGYPSNYPLEAHCTWNITARRGRYVKVTFSGIDIKDSPLCQNDAILVHDGINAASPSLKSICGVQSKDVTVTSSGRNMFIIFSSDPRRDSNKGFRATFTEVRSPGSAPGVVTMPTLPPITRTTNSFRCNFEQGFCGMRQDTLDEIDWIRYQGSTPSRYTGPNGDHTTNKGTGYYIYIEASKPAKSGDNAIVRTPWMRGRSTRCISFAYSMNGRLMGSLRLYAFEKRISDSYGHEVLLWERIGDQGKNWHTADVNYRPKNSVQSVQFYWEVYVNFYQSDVALDDIIISGAGSCSATTVPNVISWTTNTEVSTKPMATTKLPSTTKSTTTKAPTTTSKPPTTTVAPVQLKELNCTFDAGMCGWLQSTTDDFNWLPKSGKTPSYSTGPSGDHTSGSGKYLYIEASSPRKNGDLARLVSPLLTPNTHCVHLWYHMYGRQTGTLKILQSVDNVVSTLLVKTGDQGDQWHYVTADVSMIGDVKKSRRMLDREQEEYGLLAGRKGARENEEPVENADSTESNAKPAISHDSGIFNDPLYSNGFAFQSVRVLIEGSVHEGYAGDIGLDDLAITDGPCNKAPKVTQAKPKLLTELTCSFEQPRGTCGITQAKQSDDFDWTSHSGATPSSGTGPKVDHTLGRESGVYMYIETSGPDRLMGQTADLLTPKFAAGSYCVRYFVHMQGSGMGAMLVFSKQEVTGKSSSKTSKQWSYNGDQGTNWFEGKFDFTAASQARSVQFVFQAQVGPTFTSDVALDDISITRGSCGGKATTRAPTTTTKALTTTTTTTKAPTTTTTTTKAPTTTTKATTTTTTTTKAPTTTTTTTKATTTTTTTTKAPTTTTTSTKAPTTTTTTTKAPTTTTTTTKAPTTTTTTTKSPTTTTTTTKAPTTTTTTTKAPTTTTTTTKAPTTTTTTTKAPTTTTTTTKAPTTTTTTTKATTTPSLLAKLLYPTSFACNFDARNMCGMTQSTDDVFNWLAQRGRTPSGATGPRSDHTSGRGTYMYIEASSPRRYGDKAKLQSPKLSVSKPRRCVTFWYHMSGQGMGSLQVVAQYASAATSGSRKSARVVTKENIFTARDNQGPNWKKARVEVDQHLYLGDSVSLLFVGTRGRSFQSDIAIDDFCTSEGPCDKKNRCSENGVLSALPVVPRVAVTSRPKPSVTTTTKRTTTTPKATTTTTTTTTTTRRPTTTKTTRPATTTSAAIRYDPNLGVGMPLCSFDNNRRRPNVQSRSSSSPTRRDRARDGGEYKSPRDFSNQHMCGLTQLKKQDKFDWTRKSGATSSRNTGPSRDHTSGGGHYMYIEASAPRRKGDVAIMQTYNMFPSKYCVTAWYHMYGAFIGRLSVRSLQKLSNGRYVRSYMNNIIGNQGSAWKKLQVDFSPRPDALDVSFQFEGVRGNDYRGDLAIDDVTITAGRCDACTNPTQQFTNSHQQQQNFSTGCVNQNLFFVRCCSLRQKEIVYRKVRNCRPNMFTSQMLNWLC